ncbi:MAG: S9 family peptidase [Cytophagales bacterium]|nr:MAG: S9 family peptidase [Cytophagales bacterium]
MSKKILFLFSLCTILMNHTTQAQIQYPKTAKVSQTDTYFGNSILDPYRWLEVSDSSAVKNWVEEQNKITFDYLSKITYKQAILDRLTKVWNYTRLSAPFKEGDYYYYYKNNGLQNQSVLYRQKDLKSESEVFLDPNQLSTDGTVALGSTAFSSDARYFAYTTSKGGSDWQEIQVMETATKKVLTDKVQWVKFSGIAWYKNGFFYSRYDAPKEGKELEAKNEFHKVYYHTIGTDQSQDQLIYVDAEHPLRNVGAALTEDERYLFLYISEGTSGNEILYKDLSKKDEKFKTLIKGFQTEPSIIENIDDKILLLTNDNAPKYKVMLIDPNQPESTWKTIIPESNNVLNNVSISDNKIIATYLKDASTQVIIYDMEGKKLHEVQLPTIGSATGFGGKKKDKEVFYTFTSFTYPPTIYRYNIAQNTSTLHAKSEVDFKMEEYETKQVFFTSKDGTKVPMFIVHKKGIALDGNNPTLMYGYGGFNIPQLPGFSPARIPFLEAGGIYVVVNLRGGSEYGEEWHQAGMLLKKQNVFDDFIAAAEYLIKEKYTSPARLAISGGSNGGLLVGACMTQRPELFAVAIPAVGVMDMLRFHKFTIGWAWVVEYGSSERNEAEFKNLLAYSPIHNIKQGVSYPATLVKTADHDDRVVPAHSYKFIATLQEKHAGKSPVLIRIDSKAGHGAGKPTAKVLEEWADTWAFIFYNMNFTPQIK